MATKAKIKSNNQKRGGKREGAGRKPGAGGADKTSRREMVREAAVEIALASLDKAMSSYADPEVPITTMQHRWHMAMVLFGVPTDVIGAAILKPGVSARFRDAVTAAVDAAAGEVKHS